jgi:hypothetical protein
MNPNSNAQALTAVAVDPSKGAYKEIGFASTSAGGLAMMPSNFAELASFSQLMSLSGPMLRPHFREKPGACMAIATQALRWGMDPWAVANKTFFVNDQIAFESQLINAVILNSGILAEIPDYDFDGEGDDMKCTVTCILAKGGKIKTLTTPKVREIQPKNSPLWKFDKAQQLSYYAIRAWARRYAPHIVLGVYDRDEIEASTEIRGVGDNRAQAGELAATLAANKPEGAQGFDPAFVESEIAGSKTIEAEAKQAPEVQGEAPPADEAPSFDFDAELEAFEATLAAITSTQEVMAFGTKLQSDERSWYCNAVEHVRDIAQDIFQMRLGELRREEAKAREVAAPQPSEETAPSEDDTAAANHDADEEERLLKAGNAAALAGSRRLRLWFGKLKAPEFDLVRPHKEILETVARRVDEDAA